MAGPLTVQFSLRRNPCHVPQRSRRGGLLPRSFSRSSVVMDAFRARTCLLPVHNQQKARFPGASSMPISSHCFSHGSGCRPACPDDRASAILDRQFLDPGLVGSSAPARQHLERGHDPFSALPSGCRGPEKLCLIVEQAGGTLKTLRRCFRARFAPRTGLQKRISIRFRPRFTLPLSGGLAVTGCP